jgi:hypothetical protein
MIQQGLLGIRRAAGPEIDMPLFRVRQFHNNQTI